MIDKRLKILNRYISRVYPELLSENIDFYKVYDRCYSTVDSIYVINLLPGRYILSIDPDSGYKVLVELFGEDLFMEWFNREHYITFIDLLGDRVRGKRFIIDGLSFYI